MSKLLRSLLTVLLALTLTLVFVGCNDDGDSTGDAVTGEFIYQLETGVKEENGEQVEYSYYKITGYTITSDDALKMAEGDFSTVTSAMRNIKIKPTYKNPKTNVEYPVEEIASMAFSNQVILQSVDFTGSNIKTIGLGAFSGCTNLQEIKNLPFIGESADATNSDRVLGHLFGSASESDKNVTVSAKTRINESQDSLSFTVPSSLKKVSFTCEVIPECAFYGFSMLEEVEIANVKEIGAGAFYGCSQIVSIKMPKVQYVYDSAFEGCSVLLNVDFSGNTVLQYVGDNAFSGCSRLGYNFVLDTEEALTIKLPASVTYLGKGAFYDCTSLKYIELGAGIKEIKSVTFANCTELKKVTYLYEGNDFEVKVSAFAECDKDLVEIYNAQGEKQTYQDYVYGKVEI